MAQPDFYFNPFDADFRANPYPHFPALLDGPPRQLKLFMPTTLIARYDDVVAVRAVQTEDFMTADWYPLPCEVLRAISTRITNSVRGVSRVVYDISSKPPSTIEWE